MESERLIEEAEPLLQPNTYLEPFALRALGRVRGDEKLIIRAEQAFADGRPGNARNDDRAEDRRSRRPDAESTSENAVRPASGRDGEDRQDPGA